MKKISIAALAFMTGCFSQTNSLFASQPAFQPTMSDTQVSQAPLGEGEVSSQERDEWVRKIEEKLNQSLIFEARIQQEDMQNRQSFGKVWMKRPGKMRLVYDPPASMYLVANDGEVVYRDPQLDQTTEIPTERTPLGLLLAQHISLTDGVTIDDFRHQKGEIAIVLKRTTSPEDGTLTLFFHDSPLTLRAWTVIDAQGKKVNVFLKNIHNKKDLPDHLFKLPTVDK